MKFEVLNGVLMVDGQPQDASELSASLPHAIERAPNFVGAACQLGALMQDLSYDAQSEATLAFMQLLSGIADELFGACCPECRATIKAVLSATANAGAQSS